MLLMVGLLGLKTGSHQVTLSPALTDWEHVEGERVDRGKEGCIRTATRASESPAGGATRSGSCQVLAFHQHPHS